MSVASGRVVRARDVRFILADRAFDLKYARNVVGTPSNSSAVESEETVWHDVPRAPIGKATEPVSHPTARRAILHKAYFERFEYSANFPKCRSLMRGEVAGPSHTTECRRRIELEMDRDQILRQRLEAAQERRDKYLASEVERGDEESRATARPRESTSTDPRSSEEQGPSRGTDEDGFQEVDG